MYGEPTVFVVDNEASTRDFVWRLVASMKLTCRPCCSGREFFEQYDGHCLGCAVLALRIADMSGLQIQRHLQDADAPIPVIFLSKYGTISTAVRAMKAGAVDFLEKPCKEEDLWDAIQRALQLSRRRHEQLQEQLEWETRLEALTSQERELLSLVVKGKRSREIAELQNVSLRTVEARRSRLLKKLDSDSTNELMHSVIVQQYAQHRCLKNAMCLEAP